jgi:hypothetical protein
MVLFKVLYKLYFSKSPMLMQETRHFWNSEKMGEVWKFGEAHAYWHVTHVPPALNPHDIIFPEDDHVYF